MIQDYNGFHIGIPDTVKGGIVCDVRWRHIRIAHIPSGLSTQMLKAWVEVEIEQFTEEYLNNPLRMLVEFGITKEDMANPPKGVKTIIDITGKKR